MSEDCTQYFLRYREVARFAWNLGFRPDPELREIACVLAYEDAMARLFEGMVLLRVGSNGRVPAWPDGLGTPVDFKVMVNAPETAGAPGVKLRVNHHPPNTGTNMWGSPVIRLNSQLPYQFRFVCFRDWNQLAPRDFCLLQVLIERLDQQPDLVGRGTY